MASLIHLTLTYVSDAMILNIQEKKKIKNFTTLTPEHLNTLIPDLRLNSMPCQKQ